MNKTAVYGALLVALGLAAGIALGRRHERDRVEHAEERRSAGSAATSGQSASASEADGAAEQQDTVQRRLDRLASQLSAEVDERRRFKERLDLLTTELAALRGRGDETARASASEKKAVASGDPAHSGPAGEGVTTMEHALLAAGVEPTTAAEIKRRQDNLALSEIYLRDLATREGWLDTPRFAEEIAEINRQRTSVRDEIGDEAYDRYLAALDQPNRVAVNEVLLESPAAAAGVQAGDVVLRYGDTRIFSPDELVAATRAGNAGETVQVQILRGGQQLQIDVPRGPLGVRIAASRGVPAGG